MKSSDLITAVVFLALCAGGWFMLTRHKDTAAQAAYYEPKPQYFDTDPATLPGDWSGWNAKVDVFVHHNTNRPACEAIEYGWLTWHDHVPVIVREAGSSSKRVVTRTDNLDQPIDFVRVPAVELPFDRGVDISVSTRLQRNQYLVQWAHKYGFRFEPNVPNEWKDYYAKLKGAPGGVIIVPAQGHTMAECRSAQEETDCKEAPSSMRCEDNRYADKGNFLYSEWAKDESPLGVITYLKAKKRAAAPKVETPEDDQ